MAERVGDGNEGQRGLESRDLVGPGPGLLFPTACPVLAGDPSRGWVE